MITPDLFATIRRPPCVRSGSTISCRPRSAGRTARHPSRQRNTQNLRVRIPDRVERRYRRGRLISTCRMLTHACSSRASTSPPRRIAGGNDVLSDRFDRCPEAPGEKKLGPPRAQRRVRQRRRSHSGSVDHCDLVLEHASCLLLFRADDISLRRRSSVAKKMRVARRAGRFL